MLVYTPAWKTSNGLEGRGYPSDRLEDCSQQLDDRLTIDPGAKCRVLVTSRLEYDYTGRADFTMEAPLDFTTWAVVRMADDDPHGRLQTGSPGINPATAIEWAQNAEQRELERLPGMEAYYKANPIVGAAHYHVHIIKFVPYDGKKRGKR